MLICGPADLGRLMVAAQGLYLGRFTRSQNNHYSCCELTLFRGPNMETSCLSDIIFSFSFTTNRCIFFFECTVSSFTTGLFPCDLSTPVNRLQFIMCSTFKSLLGSHVCSFRSNPIKWHDTDMVLLPARGCLLSPQSSELKHCTLLLLIHWQSLNSFLKYYPMLPHSVMSKHFELRTRFLA